MGYFTTALCQILFVQGALLCYQARLEFSDQEFEESDNAYHDLNGANDVKNTDTLNEDSKDNDDDNDTGTIKETENYDIETIDDESVKEDQKEAPKKLVNPHEDSEERRKGGQNRRVNDGKRRMSKHQRIRAKHNHRMDIHNKESDLLTDDAEEEPSDRDGEIANFYFSKFSGIANTSAALGPGPVSIQLVEPTPQLSTTEGMSTQGPYGHSTIIGSSAILELSDIISVANISSDNDETVSYVRGHKRVNDKKIKSYNSARKGSKPVSSGGKLIHQRHSKKEGVRLNKHNPKIRKDGHTNLNQRVGHKNKKHNKIHKEAVNVKHNVNKLHLNDEEKHINSSKINKKFKNSAGKVIVYKHRIVNHPSIDEDPSEKEELSEGVKDEVDQISEEDKDKLSFLDVAHAGNEESQASLRDDNSETENKGGNKSSRSSPRKGIRSKIEHGDWVYEVTLFTIPDYSIKKNKGRDNKKKLKETLLGNQKETSTESVIEQNNSNKEEKNKNSVDEVDRGAESSESTEEFESESDVDEDENEYISDVSVEKDGETEIKRDERDTKERDVIRNSKMPEEESIFGEKEDKIYDFVPKHDEQSYQEGIKRNYGNRHGNNEVSEKDEYNYEYDSNLSGGKVDKIVVDIIRENNTSQAERTTTQTETWTPTIKTSKHPTKLKSSFKANDILEAVSNFGKGVHRMNTSNDPYEMFLSGQLADSFVDEVLRKVKISRKISRELGCTNETDETCDRCVELKPIKLPDRNKMRKSLEKYPKRHETAKNSSHCYRVPPPMAKFLDILVFYEIENENSFYNKIQDDSSFIFTGDYPESLSKGGNNLRYKDEFAYESSFNKDSDDRQHLKDDLNEEKNEDKFENYHSHKKRKGETREDYDSSEDINSRYLEEDKKMQGGIKKYTRRYSENHEDRNKEGTFPKLDENVRKNPFLDELDSRVLDPIVKEHSSNKELANGYTNHRRSLGISWKDVGVTNDNTQDPVKLSQESNRKPIENLERYNRIRNNDYFKQYSDKNSAFKLEAGHKLNYGDVSKNNLAKDGLVRNSFYKLPDSNRMSSKVDHLNLKNRPNYYSYNKMKNDQDREMNLNDKYRDHRTKYDGLFNYNGEYSLYPALEGPEEGVGRMTGNYKMGEGENARMVKRFVEDLPAYDDEPNVFFEIPDIEYDLYK